MPLHDARQADHARIGQRRPEAVVLRGQRDRADAIAVFKLQRGLRDAVLRRVFKAQRTRIGHAVVAALLDIDDQCVFTR
ncbi:hypothetical protein FQZ97_891390 [compost metagenome]